MCALYTDITFHCLPHRYFTQLTEVKACLIKIYF